MSKLEIVQSAYHTNRDGESFVVAIVDDAENDDTKLVIMFQDDGYTAVLSLDQLIDEEDISEKTNNWDPIKYEERLRTPLWDEDDDSYEFVY
jgi:hypothetical protein